MSRYIHIADAKGRDAEIIFNSKPKKSSVKLVTEKGEEVQALRVLKGAINNSFEGMSKSIGEGEAIAQAMITSDPEIDLNLTGRFINGSSRVYIDQDLKPISRITKKEIVHNPDGTVKEERIPKELLANILAELPNAVLCPCWGCQILNSASYYTRHLIHDRSSMRLQEMYVPILL
jgi:hypothetical protein